VIVEEIRSYLDDPGEHVHTLFDLAMFGDTPLGREIAGSVESVLALPAENLRAFWSQAYRPGNVVVAAAGDISHARSWLWERPSGERGPRDSTRPLFRPAERVLVARRDTSNQICLVFGSPRDDPGAWTREVLNAISGSMSAVCSSPSERTGAGLRCQFHDVVDYADAGALVVSAGIVGQLRRPSGHPR
jgi:predicted Zn-dependent peptidase